MTPALTTTEACDLQELPRAEQMPLSIAPIDLSAGHEWENLVARPGTAFHRRSWLKTIKDATGWPITALALRSGDRLIGSLIGLESDSVAAARLDMIPLAPYAGPCLQVPQEDQSENLAHLADALALRYCRIQMDLHPRWTDLRPFIHRGWHVEPRYTYLNTLDDDVERRAAPAVRRRARRAARAEVVIDESVPPEEFVALWAMTLLRRQVREYVDRAALVRILSTLSHAGDCEIIGARLPDGSLVAASAILYDQTVAYFWLSGFDADEPHRGASNQLCHLETLRRAARRAQQFDWLGANTPGIAEYKKSFGGQLVAYYRVRWNRPASSLAGWSRWLRNCPLFRSVK